MDVLGACRVGCVRCGPTLHSHPHPKDTLTSGPRQVARERDAQRLVAAATVIAHRLRPVCADWPEERFGALVYDAALVSLNDEMPPDDAERLRREYETHRDRYLARLREVDD